MVSPLAYGRTYRPQDLLTISKAFDNAWATIAPSFDGYEDRIDVARSKLADAVIAAAAKGVSKASQLQTMALIEFLDDRERRGTLPKITLKGSWIRRAE